MLDELYEIGERREFIFEYVWKLNGLDSAHAIIGVGIAGQRRGLLPRHPEIVGGPQQNANARGSALHSTLPSPPSR